MAPGKKTAQVAATVTNSNSVASAGRPAKRVTPAVSRSRRAGLSFPVGRVERFLRSQGITPRVSAGAPVFLAAVAEYIAAEILELAGNASRENKRQRIIPRHLQLAIRNDDELNHLLADATIAEGGVLPFVHRVLLNKTPEEKNAKAAAEKTAATPKTKAAPKPKKAAAPATKKSKTSSAAKSKSKPKKVSAPKKSGTSSSTAEPVTA